MDRYETKDSILDRITWLVNVVKNNDNFDRLTLVSNLEEIWGDINHYL